jgi:hypothetical protein
MYLSYIRTECPQLDLSFLDRDMMMRYKIGLAVGHTYAHSQALFGVGERAIGRTCRPRRDNEEEVESALLASLLASTVSVGSNSDDSSIDFDFDLDDWGSDFSDRDESDDEAFLEMNEMYGF